MALFVVTYDLHNSRTYGPVIHALHDWKAVRLLESVWLVDRAGSAAAIRDALKPHIDHDDSIAVIELKPGSDWATLRTKEGAADWLRQHLHA